MKYTRYYLLSRSKIDRALVHEDWIRKVMENPLRRVVQPDGRMRLWGKIGEAGGRYLRVVLLADGETVHNAFLDRRFKE
jgi:hypothetical protein